MNNQEELKKLKSAFTVFTVFKFVGLAVLIVGGIIISYGSFIYLLRFFNYLSTSSGDLIDAIQVYFKQLIYGGIVLAVGLATMITFSVLRNKKHAKIQELKKTIEQEA